MRAILDEKRRRNEASTKEKEIGKRKRERHSGFSGEVSDLVESVRKKVKGR